MTAIQENDVWDACHLLFGQQAQLSRGFLDYLQPEGAKAAYRQLAKQHHPDQHGHLDAATYAEKTALFQRINEAYQLLGNYFDLRANGQLNWRGSSRPQPHEPASKGQNRRRSRSQRPHQRHVPPRHLPLGLFLYYQGLISYRDLIQALTWQRRQRPVLGEIAQRWGWLDATTLERICRFRGQTFRFGERAVEMGLITPFQLQILLRYQQRLQQPIGQYFLQQGLVYDQQLQEYLHQHQEHNQQHQRQRQGFQQAGNGGSWGWGG